MLNATIVVPVISRTVKMKGGMKSGWCLTAQDNTIIHITVFTDYLERNDKVGKIFFKGYGDDNLMYARKGTFNKEILEQIREHYQSYNMTLKDLPEHYDLRHNDFLSRQIVRSD